MLVIGTHIPSSLDAYIVSTFRVNTTFFYTYICSLIAKMEVLNVCTQNYHVSPSTCTLSSDVG